jgi:hypothetical protein
MDDILLVITDKIRDRILVHQFNKQNRRYQKLLKTAKVAENGHVYIYI